MVGVDQNVLMERNDRGWDSESEIRSGGRGLVDHAQHVLDSAHGLYHLATPRLQAGLWTLLGTSVASEDNELPKELRAQLLSLAEFSISHTGKVLNGSASADVLVEINTSMMKGLRGQGQQK